MVVVGPGMENKDMMSSAKRDSNNIHFTSNRRAEVGDGDHGQTYGASGGGGGVVPSRKSVLQGPHTIAITKSETGFGFNVRGQIGEGGPMKSINGELYAPLQHVSAVLEGGAAELAGLRKGDRILEVNGISVEGVTHKQVVEFIRSGGHTLSLTVITVTQEDAERLEPLEEASSNFAIDYSERRSLPISIPEYKWIEKGGEKFTVFCIHMAGRHLCSRRYKQFDELQASLKREFCDFTFPKFPPKSLFTLSDQQIDGRRRKLEQWVERICSVRVIADCDIMQDFLNNADGSPSSEAVAEVEIKILLPDKTTLSMTIDKHTTTPTVYRMCADRIHLAEELAPYFALFELVEYSFERKLREDERPHEIYIHNYTTATNTCISFGRWLFSPTKELDLTNRYELALNYFFWQAVDEVNRGHVRPGQSLHELKALQDSARKSDYIELCRRFPGYSEYSFPPCPSDARKSKQNFVIPIVAFGKFKLQACLPDGTLESQEIEFEWSEISAWSVCPPDNDEEQPYFTFDYLRPQRPQRTVRIFTVFPSFLKECFDRVNSEREMDNALTQ
ncbi:Sorting nexin-27 [Hypsibius exemplaris]|uniref:Sorting nexin-27 n=1 Tax=Hypsibius exemplaris TaxID=2072580 RepID=A0A1W0XB38_HYPEX|nr:Sorting nexin-27 [Hypsibius exemplaris]